MKFSCIAFLAVASMAGRVSAQAESIEDRWKLDEPVITYTAAENKFTLDFTGKASANNDATSVEFYDRRCQYDNSVDFNAATPGLLPADGYELAAGEGIEDLDNAAILPVWSGEKVDFRVDTQKLANDVNIYDIVTPDLIAVTDTLTAADDGFGLMRFCARTEIGYGTGATFVDVNFIEVLITIKYELTAGFTVAGFAVEPKERVVVTDTKDTYALTAWLCDPTAIGESEIKTTALGQVNRVLPPALTEVGVAPEAFNQGALITVCVAPDDLTYYDGIQLAGLTSFVWKRTDPTEVVQTALPDGNGLSAMVEPCEQNDFCRFSSILFADFYISPGSVSGEGQAKLAFRTTPLATVRKLRAVESGVESFVPRRQLQEDASSPFDISVPISTVAEGPGAIKTAGGASYGFSALASAVALLSAALLA